MVEQTKTIVETFTDFHDAVYWFEMEYELSLFGDTFISGGLRSVNDQWQAYIVIENEDEDDTID